MCESVDKSMAFYIFVTLGRYSRTDDPASTRLEFLKLILAPIQQTVRLPLALVSILTLIGTNAQCYCCTVGA
jgi:hypothetical protein